MSIINWDATLETASQFKGKNQLLHQTTGLGVARKDYVQ